MAFMTGLRMNLEGVSEQVTFDCVISKSEFRHLEMNTKNARPMPGAPLFLFFAIRFF
jgi:hypothetical protein